MNSLCTQSSHFTGYGSILLQTLQTESTELQSGNAMKIRTLLSHPRLPIAQDTTRAAGLLAEHRNLKQRRTGMSLFDDYFTLPIPP